LSPQKDLAKGLAGQARRLRYFRNKQRPVISWRPTLGESFDRAENRAKQVRSVFPAILEHRV
jgi:hypothetical protein